AGGGLILATGTDNTTGSINNGTITSGFAGVPGTNDLFVYHLPYAGTNRQAAIGAVIANNGSTPVRLIVSSSEGPTTTQRLTLNAVNTYTGGTLVNGGSLAVGATGAIPNGGITLNNAVLFQNAGGTIGSTNVVTLNGSSGLTLAGSNTLDSLVFNNNGGVATPTVSTGGTLSLSNSTPITASASTVSTTATVNGTLNLGGGAKSFVINPISYDGRTLTSLQPTLTIGAAIQNAGLITVSGGGVLGLSGQSTFNGGVTLTGGSSLALGASSIASAPGVPSSLVSGPVGTGTLTIGAGSTVLSTAAVTILNNVNVLGNFGFDGLNNITFNGSVALPNNATTSINVAAPQQTVTFGGAVTGTNAGINKTGYGTLVVNTNLGGGTNTVTGGTFSVTPNGNTAGIGNLVLAATGTTLQLRAPGGNFNANNYGNTIGGFNNTFPIAGSVTVGSGLTVNIDLASGGATGSTFQLGTLTADNTSTVNVTNSGGNTGYRVAVTPSNPASLPNFNVAANTGLVLTGGGLSAVPTISGAGALYLGGANTIASGTTWTSANVGGAAASTGSALAPYGAGQTVTLNAGSTFGLVATPGTFSNAGFVPGGLAASFTNGGVLNSAVASGTAPIAQMNGVAPNDQALVNRPISLISTTSALNQPVIYSGLLQVTSAGLYSFINSVDDESAITIDGVPVSSINSAGGGTGLGDATGAQMNLGTGFHQIVVKAVNNGSGGGFRMLYSGPDTAVSAAGLPGQFQRIPLSALSYTTNPFSTANVATVDNAFAVAGSASATLDGLGNDLNTSVRSITLNAGSTLNVVNQFGNGWVGSTNALTVTGAGAIVNPTTATLFLQNGVSDGGLGLTKAGSGTLALGSSSGSFTGPFVAANGTVMLASPTGLSSGSNVFGGTTALSGVSYASAATTVTVGSTTGLYVGQPITGTGIPAGATIASIVNGTSFTISAATTAAGTAATVGSRASLDLNGQAVPAGFPVTIGFNGSVNSAGTAQQGAALYNSSPLPASIASPVTIGGLTGYTNAIGGYGNITISGNITDAGANLGFSKVGPNTLILSGNNTLAGGVTVAAGTLQLGSTGALGGTGTATVNGGTTLDLAGFGTARGLTINGAGITGREFANTLNAVTNTGAAATLSGTVTLGAAASIGNGGFAMSAPSFAAAAVPTPGTGSITLSGLTTGAFVLSKAGPGNLFVTNANAASTLTGLTINNGTVVVQGAGQLNSGASGTAATFTTIVNPGGTLTLDNTASSASGRLAGGTATTARPVTLQGGNFNIIGGASNVTESTGTGNLGISNTMNVVTLTAPSTGAVALNVGGTISGAGAGTVLFRGTNLGVNASGTAGSANIVVTT
ncbi:MAG TPA: autotransporter-associated beta strand repeat-containing protein, partial [Humisphaera sp.]